MQIFAVLSLTTPSVIHISTLVTFTQTPLRKKKLLKHSYHFQSVLGWDMSKELSSQSPGIANIHYSTHTYTHTLGSHQCVLSMPPLLLLSRHFVKAVC